MKTTFSLAGVARKASLLVCIFFAGLHVAQAQQQLEIVIVASAHGNSNPDAFYRPVIDKLKNYKPDIVFGEYLSPEDQQAAIAAGHLTSKSIKKRMDFLQAHDPAGTATKLKQKKAYKALHKSALNHKTRLHLASNLFMNHDMGNAEYQFYVLSQHMQAKFDVTEQAYFEKLFGGVDTLHKAGLIRKNSEYQRIFFPLLYELGHDKIYAADCQKYEAAWNKATNNGIAAFEKMKADAKADSSSAAGAAYTAYLLYSKQANERMKGIDYTSYDFLNSALYAELDEVVNFFGRTQVFQ